MLSALGLSACATTPVHVAGSESFSLPLLATTVDTPITPVAPAAAGPIARTIGPGGPAPAAAPPVLAPTDVQSPALAAPPGNGVNAGGSPLLGSPPSAGAYLALASGGYLALTGGDQLNLPVALVGQATLNAPGKVPMTIDFPANGAPLTSVHPLSTAGGPADIGITTFKGKVVQTLPDPVGGMPSPQPRAGIHVAFVSRAHPRATDTLSAADGSFSLDVRVSGNESGVIVAHDDATAPLLDLQRAIAQVGGTVSTNLAGGPLTLSLNVPQQQGPPAALGYRYHAMAAGANNGTSAPRFPANMNVVGCALQLAEQDATGPFRLTVLPLNASVVPGYTLADASFGLVSTYDLASPDGLHVSETSGPGSQVTPVLAPPDLSGLPTQLAAGMRLSWPAVPGATLYTARIAEQFSVGPPRWEGALAASGQRSLTLPSGLDLSGSRLVVHVDAWAAADMTLYSVAELRALRVPRQPQGTSGSHSASERVYGP